MVLPIYLATRPSSTFYSALVFGVATKSVATQATIWTISVRNRSTPPIPFSPSPISVIKMAGGRIMYFTAMSTFLGAKRNTDPDSFDL